MKGARRRQGVNGVETVARACPSLVRGSCPAKCGTQLLQQASPFAAIHSSFIHSSLHSLLRCSSCIYTCLSLPRFRTGKYPLRFLNLPVKPSAAVPRAPTTHRCASATPALHHPPLTSSQTRFGAACLRSSLYRACDCPRTGPSHYSDCKGSSKLINRV